jgi:hypothetical protein
LFSFLLTAFLILINKKERLKPISHAASCDCYPVQSAD